MAERIFVEKIKPNECSSLMNFDENTRKTGFNK